MINATGFVMLPFSLLGWIGATPQAVFYPRNVSFRLACDSDEVTQRVVAALWIHEERSIVGLVDGDGIGNAFGGMRALHPTQCTLLHPNEAGLPCRAQGASYGLPEAS